jgi:HPt (histidine-containing phosphotransfer) domain-containing protein
MNRSRAEIAQFLEAQRADYLRGLPERMAQIDACWARARQEAQPLEALQALERLGHGLHGTGGTFGLQALSAAGHELELAANDLLATAPTDAARAKVTQAIERVRRSLPAG